METAAVDTPATIDMPVTQLEVILADAAAPLQAAVGAWGTAETVATVEEPAGALQSKDAIAAAASTAFQTSSKEMKPLQAEPTGDSADCRGSGCWMGGRTVAGQMGSSALETMAVERTATGTVETLQPEGLAQSHTFDPLIIQLATQVRPDSVGLPCLTESISSNINKEVLKLVGSTRHSHQQQQPAARRLAASGSDAEVTQATWFADALTRGIQEGALETGRIARYLAAAAATDAAGAAMDACGLETPQPAVSAPTAVQLTVAADVNPQNDLADNPQGTTVTSNEVLHGNLAAATAVLTQLDDLHSAAAATADGQTQRRAMDSI